MTDSLVKLFGSAARVKLLRLFLLNPGEHYTPKMAALRAALTPQAARKELALFASIKLIKRSRRGYVLNEAFEYTQGLQALLLNAPVRRRQIMERIKSTGALKLVVVSGMFAGEAEEAPGLDLLVVGDRVGERALNRKIKMLESELGVELRYALLTTPDFLYRLNMSDKLVRDVLDFPHIILLDKLQIGLK